MENRDLRFIARLLWGRLTGKAYPFLVQFNITNRCNSRCNYCYAIYYNRPQDDMPLESVKKIIDELLSRGVYRLNLVGGEPLIRQDIDEIIKYAHGKGISCAMTTNGFLVKERMETVKTLDEICFSIDGQKENNDKNRGQGSFDKAISGLDVCIREGLKVQISSVLTRYTAGDVDFMTGLAEKYGCKVSFSTLISVKKKPVNAADGLYPEESVIKRALLRISELARKGKPILFSSESYDYARDWPDHNSDITFQNIPGFKNIRCMAGKYFCIIDFNGDLYPCPQLIGIFKPGNILKDGFNDAFQKINSHNCIACSVPCSNEFSMFFWLKPGILLNYVSYYWRRR